MLEKASVDENNVLHPVFTHQHVNPMIEAPEFEIQMETGPDGKQRVKVMQPMPFSLEEGMNDPSLLHRLLVASGMTEI